MSNDIRTGYEAAAKAITERAGGHYKAGNYELKDECLQCAAMLHDLKPVASPAVSNEAAELPPLPESTNVARFGDIFNGQQMCDYARAAIASAQQAAPKQALTDEDIRTAALAFGVATGRAVIYGRCMVATGEGDKEIVSFARAIEAAAAPNALLVAALQAIIEKYSSGQMVGGCVEIEAARADLVSISKELKI